VPLELFHPDAWLHKMIHDPDHDDEFLDRIEKLCRERFPNIMLAREGMEIAI
jgi:hypothetical protein